MRPLKYGGLVGAAALVIAANPAFASTPPTTTTVGVNTTGTHNWTAATKARAGVSPHISFNVWHGANNVSWNCPFGSASGTFDAGAVAGTKKIGTITGMTWGSSPMQACKAPGGLDLEFTQVGTWGIYVESSAKASNGVDTAIDGYIDEIVFHVKSKDFDVCSFDVTGRADITFNETDKGGGLQDMLVDEQTATYNLTVDNVDGCFGEIASGDPLDLTGMYNIASADGLINLKP